MMLLPLEPCTSRRQRRSISTFLSFFIIVCVSLHCTAVGAFRQGDNIRSTSSSNRKFARKRVILHEGRHQQQRGDSVATSSTQLSRRRSLLLRVDAAVGVVYALGFFLFPSRTLSTFFQYEFDPSIRKFLHMVVRMVAVNHLGYVAGLLAAPPEEAIRVATGFLTLGGIVVVYYGQTKLETGAAFWSCTVLTTLMILAHLFCL